MNSMPRRPIRPSLFFSTPTTPPTSTSPSPSAKQRRVRFTASTYKPPPPPARREFRVSPATNAQKKQYTDQNKRTLFDEIRRRVNDPSLRKRINLTQSGQKMLRTNGTHIFAKISNNHARMLRSGLLQKSPVQLRSLYYETLARAKDLGLIPYTTTHEFIKKTNISNLNKGQLVEMMLYLYSTGLIKFDIRYPKTELQMLEDAMIKIIINNVKSRT